MRALPPFALLGLVACDGPMIDGDTEVDNTFRLAFAADPHVVGDDYVCCEGSDLDTESIYYTRDRFETMRRLLHDVEPRPEALFVAGDILHQAYKYDRLEDYTDPAIGSAVYRAKEILDRFEFPVHLAKGNHDYDVPEFSRDFSDTLFREVFGSEPYEAIDHGPWRFLITNTQQGRTWDADPLNDFFRKSTGSFGREQLAWMEEQLREGKPTFLVFHHPLFVVERDEDPDGPIPDVFALIEAYKDTLEAIYVGHTHRWLGGLDEQLGLPVIVIGSVRYDADNFWIHEFDPDARTWEIVDEEKAQWLSTWAYGTDYADGEVVIDFSTPAEADPAAPYENVPGDGPPE